jgi:DNA-directed RNA polymerase subunit RPC12/RpoP
MTDQLLSVRCNHCGAPLEVSSGARFITCAHCGSQLEIKQTGSAVYTEVLGEINDRTERIERDVAEIKRQNAIEALDRQWELRRESLMVRNKNGATSEPSAIGGVIGGVVAVVFGIIWTAGAASAGAPALFPIFGVVFIFAGVIAAITQVTKASNYKYEETQYLRQRDELARQPTDSYR